PVARCSAIFEQPGGFLQVRHGTSEVRAIQIGGRAKDLEQSLKAEMRRQGRKFRRKFLRQLGFWCGDSARADKRLPLCALEAAQLAIVFRSGGADACVTMASKRIDFLRALD